MSDEPPIGATVVCRGKELLVIEAHSCRSCFFFVNRPGSLCTRPEKERPRMMCVDREDGKHVIFIEPHKYPAAKLLGEIE